jgi:hypothetical protein
MPKFAIYYVPQVDDSFYRTGSQILGYDVRARSPETPSTYVEEALGQLSTNWMTLSGPYGFHVTINHAIDCDWATISLVERELNDLLGCFDPQHLFTLQRKEDSCVGIWKNRDGSSSLVLLYEPNEHLRVFHTLIVAHITPLGQGTEFLRNHLVQPDPQVKPYEVQQVRLFYTPGLFDSWYPHFTLLNPYTGEEEALMAERLGQLFAPYTYITVDSVCLLIQPDDDPNWQIYREFRR